MELLSPAGSKEALNAAIANGANAIYLGVSLFNARRLAANFSFEELKEAIFLAHINNVKIYLTMNTLVRNNEMKKWFNVLKTAYELGIDAVIVQEITLAKYIKESFPDLEVHASTQASIMNAEAIKHFPELDLIVLARELTKDQIQYIRNHTKKKLEIFVHGHQCISVSGQCLISSLIGSRSGNRGVCASSCRKNYNHAGYLISAKDLNLADSVKEILDMGIDSIKIEGRMKSAEYVALTTKTYRAQIDAANLGKERKINAQEKTNLALSFNREFTPGFFSGEKSIVGRKMPMNRGVFLGTIRNGKLKTMHELSALDGVSFWDGKKFSGTIIQKLLVDGKEKEYAKKGDFIKIAHPSFKNYTEVYLTAKNDGKQIFNTLEKPKVNLTIKGKLGEPLKVIGKTTVESKIPLQEAKNSPLTKESFLHFFRNSPFELNLNWDVDNAFIPNSHMVQLRKDVEEMIGNSHTKKREGKIVLPEIKEEETTKGLYVKVYSIEDVKIADALGVDVIYYDIFNKDAFEAKKACKRAEFFLDTPIIMTDKDIKNANAILEKIKPHGIMVGNLGMLSYKGKKHGKYSLNTFNDYSAKWLRDHDVLPMASIELSGSQVAELKNKNFIYYAHGRIPVMHFKGEYQEEALKDEKNYVFPLRITNGNTEMLYSRPFATLDNVKMLQQKGIKKFFLDLDQNTSTLIQVYQKLLNNVPVDTSHLKEGTTIKPFKMGVG